MSKSDPDPKSRIGLNDSPEDIVKKIKKSITDFTSEVSMYYFCQYETRILIKKFNYKFINTKIFNLNEKKKECSKTVNVHKML